MNPLNYVKLQDRPRVELEPGPGEPDDESQLVGTWLNTNVASSGIVKAVVTRVDGGLTLRVFGAADPEPYDWGVVPIQTMFAESIESAGAIAFTANYDFGFMASELQSNLAQGLLIVTSLNTFKEGDCRSNYFAREYLYKKPVG